MTAIAYTIQGIPRTKKNSQRIIVIGGKRAVLQSRQYLCWEAPAVFQLQAQRHGLTWKCPVNMRAIVYRDRAVGDLLNYLAAISDVLEKAGVVANDRLIVSLDGSRMLVDRQRPRVEIELTEAADTIATIAPHTSADSRFENERSDLG